MTSQLPEQLPILYSFRRCPYAMRARMTLRYAGIQVELREVVLKNKPQPMLAASAKGTVPVLLLDNDEVLDESLDIMLWALEQNDPNAWLSDVDAAMPLVEANDFAFKPHLDGYKYAAKDEPEVMLEHRAAGVEFLTSLDARVSTNAFMLGDKLTMVDVALMPFVRQFANVDINWFAELPLSNLQAWLKKLLEDELFTQVMSKYPAWQQGDSVTVF